MRRTVPALPATSYPAWLSQVPLFAGLSESTIVALATHLRPRRYARQAIIFHSHDPGHALFCLTTGTVKLTLENHEGRTLRLRTLTPPACFGEMALLDGGLQGMQAIALTPCEVLLLERETWLALLEEAPQVVRALAIQLSRHLRAAEALIVRLARWDAHARVAHALLTAAQAHQELPRSGGPQAMSLARRDLPELTGLSRRTIQRVLHDLHQAGILTVDSRQVQVLDAGRLAHVQAGNDRLQGPQANQAA